MALKDKIILVIIFAFIIYIFIKNKDFIIFAIKFDIKNAMMKKDAEFLYQEYIKRIKYFIFVYLY